MSDITHMLSAIEAGDPEAAGQLLPIVYAELRQLAAAQLRRERPGQTLNATALVHEAYIRLVCNDPDKQWNGRSHFFAAAARAMRRILINRARDKGRIKRGGDRGRVHLDLAAIATGAAGDDDLLALDEALTDLEAHDPLCAQLVSLRFFAGLGQREAAEAMGLSPRTADRHWAYARAWLYDRLNRPD